MSRLFPAVVGLLLASAAACAVAEQRFYQVIDAQGRMQTILAPENKPAADTSAPVIEAEVTERQSEGVMPEDQPENDNKETPAAPLVEHPQEAQSPGITDAAPPEASGPDEDYIDSEELERSNFNPTRKKRFYLLNDGMGSRVEESDGQLSGAIENGPELFPQHTEAPFRVFDASSAEITDAVALKALFKDQSVCLDNKGLQKATALGRGIPQSVPIDRKTWGFVGAGGVVEIFKVGGEGLRKLTLHSYAKSDKKPAFVMPVIALADDKGCIVRALANEYFEMWYAATKTRHHRLEGSLIMASAERFVIVLLPRQENVRNEAGFPLTDDGMFAVKWHE